MAARRVCQELSQFEAEAMEKRAMETYLEAQKKDRQRKGGSSAVHGSLGVGILDENVVSQLQRVHEWVEEQREQVRDCVSPAPSQASLDLL